MAKSLICAFALLLMIFTSCSNDEKTKSNEESTELTTEGVANAVAEGISAMRIDFTQPILYNYTNAAEKDSIIKSIIEDVYDVDLKSHKDQGQLISDEFSVNILINESSKTITLQPEQIVQVIMSSGGSDEDDNKKCGGQPGDGWKSYGTCTSKPCVKEKSEEAASDYTLVSGKCLDIRIKRNTLNARVCARLVSC